MGSPVDLVWWFTWLVAFVRSGESLWPEPEWAPVPFLEVNVFEFLWGLRESLGRIRRGHPGEVVEIEVPEWGHSTWISIVSASELGVSTEGPSLRVDSALFLDGVNRFKSEFSEWILVHVEGIKKEMGRVERLRELLWSARSAQW